MEIWPGEDDNVKCIIQAGLCQWLRNKQHPMQHWYREAGDSHHRVKEQDELPSVKHSNSHMAFVIKHQYKWVRPACGISGWEWNKLGQTASCSGSWRLTRNLHCPLHPSFWEGSLGPAQHSRNAQSCSPGCLGCCISMEAWQNSRAEPGFSSVYQHWFHVSHIRQESMKGSGGSLHCTSYCFCYLGILSLQGKASYILLMKKKPIKQFQSICATHWCSK